MGAIILYNESNFLAEVNKIFDGIFQLENVETLKEDKFLKFYTLGQKRFLFDYYC